MPSYRVREKYSATADISWEEIGIVNDAQDEEEALTLFEYGRYSHGTPTDYVVDRHSIDNSLITSYKVELLTEGEIAEESANTNMKDKTSNNIFTVDGVQVTKEDFESFVRVQYSGVTNMFDRNTVCFLADITKEVYMAIIRGNNYSEMMEFFNVNPQELMDEDEDDDDYILDEYNESDSYQEVEDINESYEVVRTGGSIGEKSSKVVKKFDTLEEAKKYANDANKQLSKGEKSYYKIKYSVKSAKEEYEQPKDDPAYMGVGEREDYIDDESESVGRYMTSPAVESDMSTEYDGFYVLNSKNKSKVKYPYRKGVASRDAEDQAIKDQMKKTGDPRSNFMIHGLIRKGEIEDESESVGRYMTGPSIESRKPSFESMIANESMIPSLKKAIKNKKESLIKRAEKKGLYENFGQDEVIDLKDRFIEPSDYSSEMKEARNLIDEFSDWCSSYKGKKPANEFFFYSEEDVERGVEEYPEDPSLTDEEIEFREELIESFNAPKQKRNALKMAIYGSLKKK